MHPHNLPQASPSRLGPFGKGARAKRQTAAIQAQHWSKGNLDYGNGAICTEYCASTEKGGRYPSCTDPAQGENIKDTVTASCLCYFLSKYWCCVQNVSIVYSRLNAALKCVKISFACRDCQEKVVHMQWTRAIRFHVGLFLSVFKKCIPCAYVS